MVTKVFIASRYLHSCTPITKVATLNITFSVAYYLDLRGALSFLYGCVFFYQVTKPTLPIQQLAGKYEIDIPIFISITMFRGTDNNTHDSSR